MYVVTYTFEGETFTSFYCAYHLNLVWGDTNIETVSVPEGNTCEECDMQEAAYDSDKHAEARNEMFFHFGHANY